MQSHQVYRALGTAIVTFLTAMLVFDKPPVSLDAVWQPALQSALAFFTVLGFGAAVKSPPAN